VDVISKTIYALERLERNLDHQVIKQLREFIELTGVVTLTGVGKSFGVAQLGASLLQSVGYRASAIHTTDLLHGGLGMISKIEHNVVIFISHSGETYEVLDARNIIEQHAGDKVITATVTGNHQSELAERCKIALAYRIDEDGSKHGTIPTVSVAVQLAIINALVCSTADVLTAEQLGSYHPSGMLYEKYKEKS
jgi:arabinose-5-phosphate isomerase